MPKLSWLQLKEMQNPILDDKTFKNVLQLFFNIPPQVDIPRFSLETPIVLQLIQENHQLTCMILGNELAWGM